MPKEYANNVSRTLDPNGKSLITVIGLHDHKVSDADVNLVQDLQDTKRLRLLNNTSASGCLQLDSFVFASGVESTIYIPAFDVLFGGEVVTIAGNLSQDLSTNRVVLPVPQFFQNGSTNQPAQVYVVFLEMWLAQLDNLSGAGYFIDPNNPALKSYFAYGCVNCDPSNVIADDTIDPFQNIQTTDRAQIQWRISVQPVALTYDFDKFQFGLDQGARASETVWGQGQITNVAPVPVPPYQFTYLGGITGDSGLWRSGDGNIENSLGTLDGYSYGMPIALIFQRNTGTFDVATNPFGCADPLTPGSGVLASGVSGRYDGHFADSILPQDVIDTRLTVNLKGWDFDRMMRESFTDLISGNIKQRIARGESPGNQSIALGSELDYLVAVNPTALANTDTVGQFDGFQNGFSADERTFYTTKALTVQQKSTGTAGSRWILNDSFAISLPFASQAAISFIQVQALVTQPDGSKVPALLLQGQINITGLNSKTATVQIIKDLTNTSYDPGQNNLYVTIGVTYPAGNGMDLRKVPSIVDGGILQDAISGNTYPVNGISDYEPQAIQPITTAVNVVAVNPNYSNIVFGLRAWIAVAGSAGTQVTVNGNTTTTFIIDRQGLNEEFTGIHPIRIWDLATGNFYTVANMSVKGDNVTLILNAAVDPSSTVILSFLCLNTCQLSFNAPVKAATMIEETVLIGNTGSDQTFRTDSRVKIESVQKFVDKNVVVLACDGVTLKGISGDDTNKMIFVADNLGNYTAIQLLSASFQSGVVVLTAPPSVNLVVQPWFAVAAILPAFDPQSQLIISERYVPYQGEGVANRDYTILHTEENALVTTNGTGRAPIVGLADIYPFNRELPIVTMLPSQVQWDDSTLDNQATASFFDSNYVAKRFSNVEHTFEVPLHTNDFIEPIWGDKRNNIQFLTKSGGRGYATSVPHMGFAIAKPTPRSVLGQNLLATIAPITIYVNNVSGNDSEDGLTLATAKSSIQAALSVIPPVLRHPVTIILQQTGTPFTIAQLAATLDVIALGDGDIRAIKYYALGNLSYTIQESGRLVISGDPSATSRVVIDATGFGGFGDGPTSAFFVENSRCIFNNLEFKAFRDPALKGLDCDVALINCKFTDNLVAGSWEQGSSVIMDGGEVDLGDAGTGHILSGSQMTASSVKLTVDSGTAAGMFYVAERGSTLTLQKHDTTGESNIVAATLVAEATINSNIVCDSDFASAGAATISVNSSLQRTVAQAPFAGGVTADASSNVVTNV